MSHEPRPGRGSAGVPGQVPAGRSGAGDRPRRRRRGRRPSLAGRHRRRRDRTVLTADAAPRLRDADRRPGSRGHTADHRARWRCRCRCATPIAPGRSARRPVRLARVAAGSTLDAPVHLVSRQALDAARGEHDAADCACSLEEPRANLVARRPGSARGGLDRPALEIGAAVLRVARRRVIAWRRTPRWSGPGPSGPATRSSCGGRRRRSRPRSGMIRAWRCAGWGRWRSATRAASCPFPAQRLRRLLLQLALLPRRLGAPPPPSPRRCGAARPPADPANALQSLVSRLRRALGRPELVEQSAGRLPAGGRPRRRRRRPLRPAGRRGARAARRRATTPTRRPRLEEALALWRGDPLADDDSPEAAGRPRRAGGPAAAGARATGPRSPCGPGRARGRRRRARGAGRRPPAARGPRGHPRWTRSSRPAARPRRWPPTSAPARTLADDPRHRPLAGAARSGTSRCCGWPTGPAAPPHEPARRR